MTHVLTVLALASVALAGCDTTEAHPDYSGQPRYYEQGYVYQGRSYPPGYYQPGYPPGQYPPGQYPPGQYPPGGYGRDYPHDRQGYGQYENVRQPEQRRGPMTQAERMALGDNLVACIDDYQNSLADDRRPEVTGMKEVLASMRVVYGQLSHRREVGDGYTVIAELQRPILHTGLTRRTSNMPTWCS